MEKRERRESVEKKRRKRALQDGGNEPELGCGPRAGKTWRRSPDLPQPPAGDRIQGPTPHPGHCNGLNPRVERPRRSLRLLARKGQFPALQPDPPPDLRQGE